MLQPICIDLWGEEIGVLSVHRTLKFANLFRHDSKLSSSQVLLYLIDDSSAVLNDWRTTDP